MGSPLDLSTLKNSSPFLIINEKHRAQITNRYNKIWMDKYGCISYRYDLVGLFPLFVVSLPVLRSWTETFWKRYNAGNSFIPTKNQVAPIGYNA